MDFCFRLFLGLTFCLTLVRSPRAVAQSEVSTQVASWEESVRCVAVCFLSCAIRCAVRVRSMHAHRVRSTPTFSHNTPNKTNRGRVHERLQSGPGPWFQHYVIIGGIGILISNLYLGIPRPLPLPHPYKTKPKRHKKAPYSFGNSTKH